MPGVDVQLLVNASFYWFRPGHRWHPRGHKHGVLITTRVNPVPALRRLLLGIKVPGSVAPSNATARGTNS